MAKSVVMGMRFEIAGKVGKESTGTYEGKPFYGLQISTMGGTYRVRTDEAMMRAFPFGSKVVVTGAVVESKGEQGSSLKLQAEKIEACDLVV